jgi:single-strand DNA-binding protein
MIPFNLNRFQFTGYLCANPEVRKVGDTEVATFDLAQTQRFKKKDKTTGEKTTYVPCELWGERVKTFAKYCVKGTGIYIEAEAETNKWEDKEGKKHSRIVFRILDWKFAEAKEKNDDDSQSAE